MMISTRGRYALRVLIDLAEHAERGYVPMKEIAERQEISLKYLERILPVLSKNGLIEGVQGRGGGYRLNRPPEWRDPSSDRGRSGAGGLSGVRGQTLRQDGRMPYLSDVDRVLSAGDRLF